MAFPATLPTASVALPAASLTAATDVDLPELRDLVDFGGREPPDDEFLDLPDELRDRAEDFFDPWERFAEGFAFALV